MNNEEAWTNLTRYHQWISENVWKIDPAHWEEKKQKRRLAKMKEARRRVNKYKKSVDKKQKSVNK